ncbi:TolC family protein [Panacibacter sp. DH6]|uniref:TolC family protein n=1 Tax=Panacibacter microcysteis TaxID=2793269 RepID=A0A931E4B8_9BACT|nr:TolC family protein [Panacibacter microcysteis]MBG9375035.1 TolC family protein [Panacibacter microcysteis]
MKKILLISSLALAAFAANAQTTTNGELKTLIKQSFTYFPKIKEAENTVSTAQERLEIASTNNPVVEGVASYNFVQPKITLPFPIDGEVKDFQFAPVHNVNANVGANYMLFDFGRIKANVEKAKTDLKYAQHSVDYSKAQLANQVAIIYYNIIYFNKAIQIEDSVLAFLNENRRIIDSKLRNGDAIKIDLLNVQASIDAEENRKVDLQNNLQKQLNLLSYTTGSIVSAGTSFDFDVPLKDALSALTEAQANNLEYVLAKDKVQQAQSELAVIRSNDKPSVSLGANAGFKNGYVPNVNEVRFNYAAGATFRVPIYDGGKTRRQTKLAQTVVKQNELAVLTLDNNYKKDIEQALTDINSNMERIKNTTGQIEEAKAAEDLAASRYQNGVGTNLEITNASTNRQRAEFTRLQYEYQLCLAKVELARILGYNYW